MLTAASAALKRPPGGIYHALLAVAIALLLIAFSAPGAEWAFFLIGGVAFVMVAALWPIRVISYGISLYRGRASGPTGLFVVAPAMVAIMVALTVSNVPIGLRWAMSRPAFASILSTEFQGTGKAWRPHYLGLYRVTSVSRIKAGVVFQTDGGFLEDTGFAYLPHGPGQIDLGGMGMGESPPPSAVLHALGDGWYRWEEQGPLLF